MCIENVDHFKPKVRFREFREGIAQLDIPQFGPNIRGRIVEKLPGNVRKNQRNREASRIDRRSREHQ